MARFGAKGGKGKGKGKFFAVSRPSDSDSDAASDDDGARAGGGYDDDDVPAGATVAPDSRRVKGKDKEVVEEEEEEDEEEDEEEEEEEETADTEEDDATSADDDDDPAPKKKKAKRSAAPATTKRSSGKRRRKGGEGGASAFVDVMAAVDEEEEEEEEDDDDDFVADDRDEVAEAAAAAEARAAARAVHRNDGDEHAAIEAMAADVERRARERRLAEAAGAAAARAGGVARRPPTHADPKLWLVAARTGKEKEAVICLMQKAVDRAAAGAPLGITAAAAHDHLKGYIYVEAHKEAHVVDAVRGLRTVYGSKPPKLVPLGEMGAALAVAPPPRARAAQGAWVRVRAGAYRGDLGRIVAADPAAGRAVIHLVPRIEWPGAPPRGKGERPPQRGFVLADARAAGAYVQEDTDRETGRKVYILRDKTDMRFMDGYLVKEVALKSVHLLDAVPSLDQVQKFAAAATGARGDAARAAAVDDDDETDGRPTTTTAAPDLVDLLGAGAPGASAAGSTFVKGDKVVVTGGDLAGLRGRVLGAAPDGRPLVKPVGEFEDVDPQPVDAADLAKWFAAGDHVKVVRGAHAGATGLVVRVDGALVSIFADAAREEVTAFARDVAESAEVASGVDALGEYELHDGVALDGGVVGVIVGLGGGAARVLTSAGTPDAPDVRSCRLPDIRRKLPARGGVAQDRDGNAVAPGDAVTLGAGRAAGAAAVVKLAWRGHLFVHCRDVAEHGGFLCVRGRQCVLKGGAAASTVAAARGGGGAHHLPLKSPAPHRFGAPPPTAVLASPARAAFGAATAGPGFAPRSAAAPVAGGGRALAPNAALVGRTLKAAKGPYRGYAGRVVSATETHVRMELEARATTVTVPLADLNPADVGGAFAARAGGGGAPGAYAAAAAPGAYGGALDPGRTPLHPAAGGATPLHAWGGAGSATPLHSAWGGGATPLHAPGSATPGGAWGAGATPAHAWGAPPPPPPPAQPAAATPGFGATPSWGAAGTQQLPAAASYTPSSFTPAAVATPGFGGDAAAAAAPPARPAAGVALVPGAVVRVRGGGLAVVVTAAAGATVEIADVAAAPGGALARVPGSRYVAVDSIAPERPAKGDAVVVVEGRDAGRAGELIGLHASDGVVRLDGGADNIKVVEAAALAKRVAV